MVLCFPLSPEALQHREYTGKGDMVLSLKATLIQDSLLFTFNLEEPRASFIYTTLIHVTSLQVQLACSNVQPLLNEAIEWAPRASLPMIGDYMAMVLSSW